MHCFLVLSLSDFWIFASLLFFFCTSSNMASSSYNVNRFYAFVLSVEYFINLNFFYPLCINIAHSVSFFCYDAFLQSKIICFLIDHQNKLNMISITTYQCFGYFFFLCYSIYNWSKKQFFCASCFFHIVSFISFLTIPLRTRTLD